MGGSAIAANLGPVDVSMTYTWTLPSTIVVANAPVYLGLEPVTTDAPRYWNTKGMAPPELVIDFL